MKKKVYKDKERRQFVRLNYVTPLAFKICQKKTISKLLKGYTSNISQAGLFCNLKDKVKKNDILWLSFDRGTLSICESLETKSLIYQSGIVGKVIWIRQKKQNSFNVGVQFITREEKNLTHIYPKIYFLKKFGKYPEEPEEDQEKGLLEEIPQEGLELEQPDEEA